MKKVFMLLAVAAFFSTTVVSCSEEKAEDKTESPEDGKDKTDGDESE